MKGESVATATVLAALGLLALGSAMAPLYVEWEWWAMVNILCTMALCVSLVVELFRRVRASAQ